jgi:hypothetical protein
MDQNESTGAEQNGTEAGTSQTTGLEGTSFETVDQLKSEYDRVTKELQDQNYYHELGRTVYDLGIDKYETYLREQDKISDYLTGKTQPQATETSGEDFRDKFDRDPQGALADMIGQALSQHMKPLQDTVNNVQRMAQETAQSTQWQDWESKNNDLDRADFQKFLQETKYDLADMTKVYRAKLAGDKALLSEAQKKAERAKMAATLRGDSSSVDTEPTLDNPKSPREAMLQAKRMIEAGHSF